MMLKIRLNREDGQALTEFALVLPLLVFLLIGIMEIGWVFMNAWLIANASREGARAAALGKTTAEIQNRVNQTLSGVTLQLDMKYSTDNGVTWMSWPLDSGTHNGVTTGCLIKITVITSVAQLSLTKIFPESLTVSQRTIMKREPT